MTAGRAEVWNPLDGSIQPLQVELNAQGATTRFIFAPYESRVFVFTRRPSPELKGNFLASSPPEPIDLSRNWRVRFGQSEKTFAQLRSWTDDSTTRFYSGTVTYEKEVLLDNAFTNGNYVHLDFGEGQAVPITPRKNGMRAWFDAPVRDAAVVYVNDQRAGSVWCVPFRLEVRKFLKPGINRFRIVVGNTAINHLAGTKLPDYKDVHAKYGERFQPQDMENLQPLPSGLLGKIRLVVY